MRATFLVPSGYNFRAVLAFCRALRAAGQTPAIVACTSDDPIFRTEFAREVVYTRASRHLELPGMAAAAMAARIRASADRVVLAPTSEFLVRWALRHRQELAGFGCDLPLPAEATYLRVTDKSLFTEFCRGRGLPVPAELPRVLTPADLPAVAKPRWNVAPDGRSLYPWLLRTAEDLARFYLETQPEEYFFQEWVEGRSFYLLFHMPREGQPTIYSQENLAQQPGGKSIVLARSAKLHLRSEAGRWADALRAAGFFGLVMIEVRERRGEYVLIEANPRLWGPLQLCVDGAPELLRRYIAEYTGVPMPVTIGPRPGPVHYLWWGGAESAAPVWHGRTPWFPRFTLWRHLRSDVFLRPDSWSHFFHERKELRPTSAAPFPKDTVLIPTPYA